MSGQRCVLTSLRILSRYRKESVYGGVAEDPIRPGDPGGGAAGRADIHVHLVAAVPNALTVEYFSLDEDIYNFERLLPDRLQPKDGLIPLRDRTGVGLDLDRAAVERFRIG